MLTHQQQKLLFLIRDRLEMGGVPPSFDEMRDALGLASKSGIHRLMMGLEERGFIRRLPQRARAIEILKMPEAMLPDEIPAVPPHMQQLEIPLYGRIAAGTAIEALRDPSRHIAVPSEMLGRNGAAGHYALEISGDSMIEAGILDGDTVLIRETPKAEIGDLVVALIDDQEATLKRFNRGQGQIILEPANRHYRPILLDPARVKIQGRLIGLLRHY
jgi:repressor LexA